MSSTPCSFNSSRVGCVILVQPCIAVWGCDLLVRTCMAPDVPPGSAGCDLLVRTCMAPDVPPGSVGCDLVVEVSVVMVGCWRVRTTPSAELLRRLLLCCVSSSSSVFSPPAPTTQGHQRNCPRPTKHSLHMHPN